MSTFNPAQFDDLCVKSQDLYAQTKYSILLDYLGPQEGQRVLVAGCGSGELCWQFAARGHHVLGIDPEPKYVELALRQAADRPDLDCAFEVASIEDYAGPGAFDCVVSTDVLEHIADDRTAFDKLAHLVKPGGTVLIAVPAGPCLFGYHDEQLGHYRRYTGGSLRKLVGKACTVERLRYFGLSLLPVCYLFSKVLRKPYPVGESCDESKSPWRSWALRKLLDLDRRVPMPAGTSLLLKAVRKQATAAPVRLAA